MGLGTFQIVAADTEAAVVAALQVGYMLIDTADCDSYRNEAD